MKKAQSYKIFKKEIVLFLLNFFFLLYFLYFYYRKVRIWVISYYEL